MSKKDLAKYKRKYQRFRHHAWAALGFLSAITAVRLIFINSASYLNPIILILALYAVVALLFTYRYSAVLSAGEEVVSVEHSYENVTVEKEKIRAKIEKKKAKAVAKKTKKSSRK